MSDADVGRVWTRRVYERHLDLLLAEELECNPRFLSWFLERVDLRPQPDDGQPATVTVRLNENDTVGEGDGSNGENDLLLEVGYPDGRRVRVLIEDKLDAIVQPSQGDRYRRRVEHHQRQVDAAACAVVAPADFLASRAAELEPLVHVSIEDITVELRRERDDVASEASELSARLDWRARQLIQLRLGRRSISPDHGPTITARNRIVSSLLANSPSAVPNLNSMRTANTGWLYFDSPDCLVYKVVHGWVDVYLRDLFPGDPDRQLAAYHGGGPDGFLSAADSVGNLLFRRVVRSDVTSRRMRPITDIGVSELDLGASCCADAIVWIETIGSTSE